MEEEIDPLHHQPDYLEWKQEMRGWPMTTFKERQIKVMSVKDLQIRLHQLTKDHQKLHDEYVIIHKELDRRKYDG